jgi:hypothetical protein
LLIVFFHQTQFLPKKNFPGSFTSHWVLNKYPTVWLDEAKPANTCIPFSLLGNVPMLPCSIPASKNTFASIKHWQNLVKSIFKIKKSEKEFDRLSNGNAE